MKTLFLVLVLLAPALAQTAEAPALAPDMLAAWQTSVSLADQRYAQAERVLAKTAAFQEWEAARQQAAAIRADIQQRASKRHPGYTLNVDTWTLIKVE